MKLHSLAFAAVALLTSVTAQAVTYNFSGTLTTDDPTFNRPFTLDTLSGVGTSVYYQAFSFSVTDSGSYDFLSVTGEPTFDNFTLLYSPSLVPEAGLTNLLALNDDFGGSLSQSGFSYDLTAATAYVYVTTTYANDVVGGYSNSITGPGSVIPAVPEPQTYALMALGLGVIGAAMRRRSA